MSTYQPPPPVGQPAAAPNPAETGYKGNHPIAAFFHIIFKFGAILTYILKMLGAGDTGCFIAVTLFIAADFWTVKNVTGRLLVSLRWWNRVRDDGSTEWIFESGRDVNRVSGFDKYYFWVVTGGFVIFWAVFTVFNLLTLSLFKLTLPLLGLVLSGSNAGGYLKCSREAKKKISQFILQQAVANPGVAVAAMGAR